MILICAIKDEAIESYGQPMFFKTEKEAIRVFINEALREDSRIFHNPEDFDLYKIGLYEETTGELQGMKHTKLMRGVDTKIKIESLTAQNKEAEGRN